MACTGSAVHQLSCDGPDCWRRALNRKKKNSPRRRKIAGHATTGSDSYSPFTATTNARGGQKRSLGSLNHRRSEKGRKRGGGRASPAVAVPAQKNKPCKPLLKTAGSSQGENQTGAGKKGRDNERAWDRFAKRVDALDRGKKTRRPQREGNEKEVWGTCSIKLRTNSVTPWG